MNTKQAAHYLGKAVVTLKKWRQQKKGPPYYKIGGRIEYDKDKVDQWVRSTEVC